MKHPEGQASMTPSSHLFRIQQLKLWDCSHVIRLKQGLESVYSQHTNARAMGIVDTGTFRGDDFRHLWAKFGHLWAFVGKKTSQPRAKSSTILTR
eukprot:958322-Pelagomonas_calceolata.AAC.1